ncbi:MAG: hypothetical protein LBS31_05925 [Candidatus Adiutrix sp.]|jgi:hypothetical protein|nr:hypothetical protein [Candidatus Adiutrix sp.]
MSINGMLFSVQNMAPALLNVGVGKAQNYNSLSELSGLLSGESASAASTGATDKVSLTFKNISEKIVTDMAAVTAETIKEFPELDNDYVIAVIDDGQTREARVYRRSDILENFEGSEEEKEALKASLDANPLLVYSSASGLPETSADEASQALAAKLNNFLKTNKKVIDILEKASYDPFASMTGSTYIKNILNACASPALKEEAAADKEEEIIEENQEELEEEEQEEGQEN